MRFRGTAAAVTAVLATLALGAVPAQATIALGQTSDNTGDWFTDSPFTEIQTGSEQSPSYTVPAGGGEITSWSNEANVMAAGFMQLKIFRPTSQPDQFAVVAASALEPITPGQLNTFSTQLPVQAGDVLGYSRPANTSMSAFFFTPNAGDTVAQAPGADDPVGGVTGVQHPQGNVRLNISAVLHQQPAVISIDTSSGPIAGGTPVTISGHEFTGATAVSFGSIPAASFTVDSETQITAVSPAAAPGPVGLTVTTPLGTSPSVPVDNFTYTACVVPKLKTKKLKQAKRSLRNAGCKPGTIKRKKVRSARVIKQHPKPGRVLAPGTSVDVTLGK